MQYYVTLYADNGRNNDDCDEFGPFDTYHAAEVVKNDLQKQGERVAIFSRERVADFSRDE